MLTQNRKYPYAAIATVTLVFACMAIGGVSAQTFNPQQPPDFGNFNGTRPDFGGNPPDFNGSGGFPGGMGPGGDFNGSFPERGDGNFSRPNFSGAPNQFDSNGGVSPQAVSGPQTDYILIIAAVIVVVGVVAVAALLTLKRKNGKSVAAPPVGTENFDF